MTRIEQVANGPIHKLMVAFNHYITTAEHIGDGVALPVGDDLAVCIPYAPCEFEDSTNWRCLEARLQEIVAKDSLNIRIRNDGTGEGRFTLMIVTLPQSDITRLTTLLKAKPGPLGWGSLRTFLTARGLEDD